MNPLAMSDDAINLAGLLSSQGYDVFKLLCSKLSPPDIYSLSNTCRSLQWIKQRRWNINAHLSRFFKEPLEFRSLMAKHNAVVSGSNALQFLEGSYWPESDLDLYVPGDEAAVMEFMWHFVKEGYELKPYSWQAGSDWQEVVRNTMASTLDHVLAALVLDPDEDNEDAVLDAPDKDEAEEWYEMKHISGVFSLARASGTGRKVQIVVAKKTPLDSVINDFYSTLVLNFYTWDKAYSLFPWLTFRRRVGVVIIPMNEKVSRCLVKYVRRGYGYTNVLDPEDESPSNGLQPHRRIGDALSWTMDLDTAGVSTSGFKPVPKSVNDYSTFACTWYEPYHYFALQRTDEEREMPYWDVSCKTFVSPILEHTYLYDAKDKGHENVDERWVSEFGARAQKYSLLACWMFEDAEVTKIAKRGWIKYDYTFPEDKLPDCFKYRDGEVTAWYDMWKERKGIVFSKKRLT